MSGNRKIPVPEKIKAEPTITQIMGLDISLTSTGVSLWRWKKPPFNFTLAPPRRLSGMDRFHWIFERLTDYAGLDPDRFLAVVEGISYGHNMKGHAERSGLYYTFLYYLWRRKAHYVVVPPTVLKKFATGKGNAHKDQVLKEVYKRFGQDAANSDVADAIVLNYIGRALCEIWEPTTSIQRTVIEKLESQFSLVALARQEISNPS